MAKKGNGQRKAQKHTALPARDHNGSWRIRWVDADGKRRSKNFPENSYKEAVAELERIKGEIRAIKDGRKPRPQKVPTLNVFVETYYSPNRILEMRSPKDAKSILRKHLLPTFGKLPLTHITTEKIEKLKADLAIQGLKAKTIRNILALLQAILNYASELDYLYRLPKIKKPKLHREEYQYLQSDSDVRAFLNEAKERKLGTYAFFTTAVYTGMRAGELFGLRWKDVSFSRGLITIQRSFDKPTKSGNLRHIPILSVLAPILKGWKLQNPNDLVFPNEAGNMHAPNPRLIKYAHRFTTKKGIQETKGTFGEILEAANLPRIRFHDLRHTFASHWVMKGGDLFKLQKILGHADQQMVQRYAHLAPEAFEKDRDIFGETPPETAKVHSIDSGKRKQAK